MSELQQEIRDWLNARPDWLQQAAELLLSSGSASDEDLLNIVERLKTPEGQQVTTLRTFGGLAQSPPAIT